MAASGTVQRAMRAGVVLALAACVAAPLHAQNRATSRRPPETAPAPETLAAPASDGDSTVVARLKQWTNQRFRGSLDVVFDTASADAARVSSRPAPRIETRIGSTRDTVVALHFANALFRAAYAPEQRVRLADPSGVTTPLEADVVARYAFRAPMVPGADSTRSGGWRYGWVYLVVLPREVAVASGNGFAGWRVVPVPPQTARRRAAPATRQSTS